MCLLSPQHMAQQTVQSFDGFNSKDHFGILTFGGFHHTIPYNATKNLPILFLATDLSTTPSLNINNNIPNTNAAFLSSTDLSDESTSNITSH